MAQKEFKDIDKHFDELKSKDRFKREPIWYKPLGMNSIRQIARYVKRLSEYDIFYGKGSEVTHSSSYKDHIIMRKGEILFKDIRNLEDCHTLINFLVSIVFKTYRSILNYYRPGEIQNFNRKYVENWREAFRTIRQVTYKYPEDKKTII